MKRRNAMKSDESWREKSMTTSSWKKCYLIHMLVIKDSTYSIIIVCWNILQMLLLLLLLLLKRALLLFHLTFSRTVQLDFLLGFQRSICCYRVQISDYVLASVWTNKFVKFEALAKMYSKAFHFKRRFTMQNLNH